MVSGADSSARVIDALPPYVDSAKLTSGDDACQGCCVIPEGATDLQNVIRGLDTQLTKQVPRVLSQSLEPVYDASDQELRCQSGSPPSRSIAHQVWAPRSVGS